LENNKKIIFSGMQPSGTPTLGNYLGALKNWNIMQKDYRCLFSVVDLHALTVRREPKELRQASLSLMALYIALGLDPSENIIFYQSQVPQHTQLSWILNCYAYVGELNRMTQYKEKSAKHSENINSGLFTYPVLMASDILLYQTDCVPVGEDQRQHLEIARDIAIRFNNIYGETFKVPESYIGKAGARVMGLQDPEKKMSKSGDDAISILDDPKVIMNKVKRAVTDSDARVYYDPSNKPGISNMLNIYSAITGKSIEECSEEFAGAGYGDFKKAVGEVIVNELEPVQKKYNELISNKDYLNSIAKEGAEKAQNLAFRTYNKVCKKIGLIQI
jgi:tryptophanyl-tRNA synthetase